MRIIRLAACIAVATLVSPIGLVSQARQAGSIAATCKTSSTAEAFDCDCIVQNEAGIRQKKAQDFYDSTHKRLEPRLKAAQAMPPSPGRDAEIARIQKDLAAPVDPSRVSQQSVYLEISSKGMCKSRQNFQQATYKQCTSSGKGEALCQCTSAFQANDWVSTGAIMSQSYRIDVGTRALQSCEAGGKPASTKYGAAAPAPAPAPAATPGSSLPSTPNITLPGNIPIPLPGNSASKGVQCGVQVCKSNQKCVTEKVLGVSIPQCK